MSERNGDHPSVVAAARDITKSVMSSVPAQFIILVMLNVIFVGGLLWFLSIWLSARIEAADKMIAACLQHTMGFVQPK